MRASVVIRARDEAAAIGRTLDLLARQTVEHEIVLVDSGSRDDTVAIARDHGVERVIEIPAGDFTYGGALNLGAAEARAPIVVALSAHAFPDRTDWLERMVAHFDDPAVACACGSAVDADFRPLAGPVRQDFAMLAARPYWGYSNSAGGFRASLWARRPFREDMPGTEDREWSWWALEQGHVCVLDPALLVDHDHSDESLRDSFRRYEREHRGYAMFLDLPDYRAGDVVREWWRDQGGHRSLVRARLDPRRAARLMGKWAGRRRARS